MLAPHLLLRKWKQVMAVSRLLRVLVPITAKEARAVKALHHRPFLDADTNLTLAVLRELWLSPLLPHGTNFTASYASMAACRIDLLNIILQGCWSRRSYGTKRTNYYCLLLTPSTT